MTQTSNLMLNQKIVKDCFSYKNNLNNQENK